VLVSPQSEKRLSMKLDLPMETSAVAADLRARQPFDVAVDAEVRSIVSTRRRASVEVPTRREVGEFVCPVFADLDGDGRLRSLSADSRGGLQVLDSPAICDFKINATNIASASPHRDVDGDGKPELSRTEAGDVYCVNGQGDLLWFNVLDGCFGRALPLIADATRTAKITKCIFRLPSQPHPGLFALDAATGKQL